MNSSKPPVDFSPRRASSGHEHELPRRRTGPALVSSRAPLTRSGGEAMQHDASATSFSRPCRDDDRVPAHAEPADVHLVGHAGRCRAWAHSYAGESLCCSSRSWLYMRMHRLAIVQTIMTHIVRLAPQGPACTTRTTTAGSPRRAPVEIRYSRSKQGSRATASSGRSCLERLRTVRPGRCPAAPPGRPCWPAGGTAGVARAAAAAAAADSPSTLFARPSTSARVTAARSQPPSESAHGTAGLPAGTAE